MARPTTVGRLGRSPGSRSRLLVLAFVGGCSQAYYLDFKDIDLEPPVDLSERLARFRSGRERWHGDPRAVADLAIRTRLDVPWKADRFRAERYDVKESPEWGTYVVRGYPYPSGHVMRYRVKVRPYHEIWYPIQVSHYKQHELPHPALED